MTNIDIEVNDRLRQLRNILQLSQKEFSAQLGVNQSYLSEIERGKKEVTTRINKSLFAIFQVSSNWLMNGIGEIFISDIDLKNTKNENSAQNPVPDKRYFKTTIENEVKQGSETPNSQAVLVVTEEELERRVRDLEYHLERIYRQFMYFSETWWHLLGIEYSWLPLEDYMPPRKAQDFARESEESNVPLMKDGMIVKVYDTLSIEGKLQYYKELEEMRTVWQFELGYYIKQVYLAVWRGKEDFNKLVNGKPDQPVSEERLKEIHERLAHFAKGNGMAKVKVSRKEPNPYSTARAANRIRD